MGNKLPKMYVDTKKLSNEELILNIQKEIDYAYSKYDIEKYECMYLHTWNTQVYLERNITKDTAKKIWFLEKKHFKLFFDKYNIPYYATVELRKTDLSHTRLLGFKFSFIKCPTCSNNNTSNNSS